MSHADAQVGHPGGPVELVRHLRHDHLGCAGPGGRRGRARAAVVHHGGHPAEQRLLVDLADGETVVLIVDQGEVGPAGPEQDAAALGPDRLDDGPGDLLRLAHGHAAEAHVHRWRAGVQERLQLFRERAFVRQDPRPGLHHVEVGRLRPGGQGRVRRQPRVVGGNVVADVVHRGQAERRPVGVDRRAEHRVHALSIQVPQHPVVGHVRRDRLAVRPQRRVVGRRQVARGVGRVHVADATFLAHRLRAGRGRGQAGGHEHVTSLGRPGDRVGLPGDHPGRQVRRRRWRLPGEHLAHHLAHRLAGRHQRHADAGQQVREVRRRAHPHLRAECPQRPRESHHRFDVSA